MISHNSSDNNNTDAFCCKYLENAYVTRDKIYIPCCLIRLNLAKRTWQYCQQLSTMQGLLCNTTHGFERVFSGISQAIFDAFIHDRLSQALTNGRGNKSPRSIRHTYDKEGLCT